ncbi:MAG: hypothetical protein ACYS6K_28555 [Planctomycetota bacterium]|jgi:hypothetical protein
MKKALVVLLVFLGVIVGAWLARENKKLFELPIPVEERQGDKQQKNIDNGKIALGMEIWQVKEALGVPEKRNVLIATEDMRKEEWIYDSKRLYFTNGVLIRLQEGEELQTMSENIRSSPLE